MIKALIDAGADLQAMDDYGQTSLDVAKNRGNDSAVEIINKMLGNV